MKKTYTYDEKTKEFKNEINAQIDPLESKLTGKDIYLLPANATWLEPPVKEGYAAVWNGEAWDLVEDYRKKEYWLPEDKYGTPGREVKELGPLPEGATLTAPEQTLEEIKSNKISSLKYERDSAEVKPIAYQGYTFDYDDKARERINAAIVALEVAGAGASLTWTTADNKDVKVIATDLRGVIAAVAMRSNKLHSAYRAAKLKVEAATSKEELDTIILEEE